MHTIRIPGVPDTRPEPSALARGLPPGTVETKQAVRVQATRAGAVPIRLEGLKGDDVVEIELVDGLRLWSRVDDIERDLGLRRSREAADVLDVPAVLSLRAESRGAASWAIKALKIVGLDIEERIAAYASRQVEGRLEPGPGLYRCDVGDPARLIKPRSLDASGPTLVFLHGTASSTSGSFGGLWDGGPAAVLTRLAERYDGRVLALQHRTLTESPIENARDVVKALLDLLGKGAELHLVSHSRGGLVGELIARAGRLGAAPFTRDDIALFSGPARERYREALTELNRLLQRARFTVGRFVRVACPARGTTLADGRLDRYLSVIVNLLDWAGLGANPVFDGVTSLLAGVLKQRTRPEELPGLEAMMPASPLIALLNDPQAQTTADLHVLGGDLEGEGAWGRLKSLATDLYYREDHDLVVNTPAMLGGTRRESRVRYFIDTGPEVTHFNYFRRGDTAGRLAAVLLDQPAEFRELAAQPFAVSPDDYRKRALGAQPIVFVLPGIMGSVLSVGKQAVWINPLALATGGLGRLQMSAAGVSATGLLRSGYDRLCEFLATTHEVVPFPYDWRRPLGESADALRVALEKKLGEAERRGQPIRLVAHSMGGLVVRAMLGTRAGQAVWERMGRQPGSRLVMLGTPNGGSHAITAMLMGRDDLVKKLALLDLTRDYRGLLETIAGFDGVLDLLPGAGPGDGLDCFQRGTWDRLFAHDVPSGRGLFSSTPHPARSAGFAWVRPEATRLRAARRRRDQLAAALDPTRTVYVAGVAEATPVEVVVDESAPAGRRVRVMATAYGDGRVTWATGIPAGVPTYYLDAVHGDLADEPRSFPALLDLLTIGATSKLETVPPRRRAAATEHFEMPEPMPAMLPDEQEVVASALGGRRRREQPDETVPPVEVRIVHDNLVNATSPVLVGHYQHDVIVAAEAYLDRQLGGRLTALQRMELYPGPVGTAAVVLNAGDERAGLAVHPGAVVAGLGMVGDVSPGRLTTALARALTEYGAERLESERRRRQRSQTSDEEATTVSMAVTSVLVGSGDGGVTLSDSVQCLLRAVAEANRRLQAGGETQDAPAMLTARIDRLDVVELYEDRAIEAVYALRALARSATAEGFLVHDLLVAGADGQRRARFDVAPSWWQRIRITTDPNTSALKFEAVTQQARAQSAIRPGYRKSIEEFVSRANATTASDPGLSATLYEMLVPNDFKVYAPDRRRLALLVDVESAGLPWELIHDKYDRGARPVSVESGMIRQLLVPPSGAVARAPGQTALVIGNPLLDDERFPPLPGAEEEGAAVTSRLVAHGFETTSLLGIDADAISIMEAMHERPWRILHLAAHGVFQYRSGPDAAPVTGLVMSDGLFLSADEAAQMRFVPELVFINCCHLGNTQADVQFHQIAANLGTHFIRAGARAVIAAGWAVDDRAAKAFADCFYDRLCQGANFGDAVQAARADTFARYGNTNTWGAYQCYGDPAYTLTASTTTWRAEPSAAPVELLIRAEQIAGEARSCDDERRAALCDELEERIAAMPVAWWERADLCAAIGMAFGELDRFERATVCYERVLRAEHASASVRSLEQLANLTARLAVADGGAKAADGLRRAERAIRSLLAIGKTAQRFALLASVYKRRALVSRGAARRKALERMTASYRQAAEIAEAASGDVSHPLTNAVTGRVVLSWRGGAADRRAIAADLDRLEQLGRRLRRESTGFFHLAVAADHLLLEALSSRTTRESDWRAVEQAYREAGWRGIYPRQRRSMIDHLDFLAAMAGSELGGPAGRALGTRLERLARALEDGR